MSNNIIVKIEVNLRTKGKEHASFKLPHPLEDVNTIKRKRWINELKTNFTGLTISTFTLMGGVGMLKSSINLVNKSKESFFTGAFGGGLFFVSLGLEIAGLIGIASFTRGLIEMLRRRDNETKKG